ncbi:MAG: hypothetical protein IJ877_06110 [Candidatus Gastranaerophilales bacterium]|nr:hypothetical protein [Candidatus Gastranaerophilales bacterium]
MNKKQIKKLNKNIHKLVYYSKYVDCFNRILDEFIQNGDDNLNPCDIPNLTALLAKYSKKIYLLSLNVERDIEFI